MPHAASTDGARIYYETAGSGPPVLLIMGLGSNAYGWYRTIPWLSERYHAIAFDNRGTGRSDVPAGAYSIAQMAADAAAVLDAAGHDRAHIVGASLGGMIAQRFALAYPERVESLVLICTTHGGSHAIAASQEVMTGLVQGGEDPATVYRQNAWFLYGDDTRTNHPERIEEDLDYRGKIPTQPTGYLGQLQAAMGHDTWDELASITAPTLVVHGESDILIPTANGTSLAGRIAGSELVLLPGAGHMLQADAGDDVREVVLRFLDRATGRNRESS